ncbi:MAG: hypothetical protein LC772_02850 [Chloroflexi bacterium]|nr:hypothetical protein [Chloroflexota bacterium]
MRSTIVTGHRGAAGLEPENTLRSFRRACELGVDHVETDVHVSRDAQVVCIHDAGVDRTTGAAGEVRAMTLAEIHALDAGMGERIPTLQAALEVVRGKAVLQIIDFTRPSAQRRRDLGSPQPGHGRVGESDP